MLNKIEKIESLGIFQNYIADASLKEYVRYNLVYGWNGSGKSTLSKLFYSLSTKNTCTSFPDTKFLLKNNGELFESQNLASFDTNIFVFNDQFVRENIDWDSLVKSLLYISKGKVEEKAKLVESNAKLLSINTNIDNLEKINVQLNDKNEAFLTDAAREIKKQFEVLRTDDNKYINYNKTKLRALINKNKKLKYKRNIVSKSDVEQLKVISRLEFLKEIDINLPKPIEIDDFNDLNGSINFLLKQDIVSKSIKGLKNNQTLSNWIETGLHLHEDLKKCKFCNNIITDERRKKLNAHFNENYKKIKEDLDALSVQIMEFKLQSNEVPHEIEVYPFLKETIYKELNIIKKNIFEINLQLDSHIDKLNLKKNNPFDLSLKVKLITKKLVDGYNNSLKRVNEIIDDHNETSKSFESKVNDAKLKLELYYAQSEIRTFKYFDKVSEFVKNQKKLITLEEKTPLLEKEILRLEASLTDEILGGAEFNTKLHRFLNHSDISLEFDKKDKGYKIKRKTGNETSDARFLSEGEKTAISFVYFLAKLEEDIELLKKSIVVIDDPISSFDSNHLFNAYSFIRNVCNDKIEQLFILTHNFVFFKLVRDWLNGKNKKGKKNKSNFYFLQSEYNKGLRETKIHNADKTLMQYSSEYHFLFKKIIDYKNQTSLSLEDCFTIANISRKFLEIFLSFKFPKKRNDFYALLNAAITDKRYETMKDRVYKFINRYSHGDRIESFDDTVDNMISESNSVIQDFLKLIKKVDSTHYEELLEIVNS